MEKNPLKNNKPIKFINLKFIIKLENKFQFIFIFIERVSWEEKFLWRIEPTLKNRRLLKNPCLKRWNRVKIILKFLIIKNKNLIWERVENATIFLKSFS